jgi:hypothetical protein
VKWKVNLRKKVVKQVTEMPLSIQERFRVLVETLMLDGPTGPHRWRNYGKLKDGYHCHLSNNHQWIACWRSEGSTLFIEVYYAGSHQSAPY